MRPPGTPAANTDLPQEDFRDPLLAALAARPAAEIAELHVQPMLPNQIENVALRDVAAVPAFEGDRKPKLGDLAQPWGRR